VDVPTRRHAVLVLVRSGLLDRVARGLRGSVGTSLRGSTSALAGVPDRGAASARVRARPRSRAVRGVPRRRLPTPAVATWRSSNSRPGTRRHRGRAPAGTIRFGDHAALITSPRPRRRPSRPPDRRAAPAVRRSLPMAATNAGALRTGCPDRPRRARGIAARARRAAHRDRHGAADGGEQPSQFSYAASPPPRPRLAPGELRGIEVRE
jgi:hypothetical protein